MIEGHCDERGTAEYNHVLGKRRAQAVKRYLDGQLQKRQVVRCGPGRIMLAAEPPGAFCLAVALSLSPQAEHIVSPARGLGSFRSASAAD